MSPPRAATVTRTVEGLNDVEQRTRSVFASRIHTMLTILNAEGNAVPLDVDVSIEIENLKALIEVDFGIPSEQQAIHFQGKELMNGQDTLESSGVKEGDLLVVLNKESKKPSNSMHPTEASMGDSSFAELVRMQLLRSPQSLQELQRVSLLRVLTLGQPNSGICSTFTYWILKNYPRPAREAGGFNE